MKLTNKEQDELLELALQLKQEKKQFNTIIKTLLNEVNICIEHKINKKQATIKKSSSLTGKEIDGFVVGKCYEHSLRGIVEFTSDCAKLQEKNTQSNSVYMFFEEFGKIMETSKNFIKELS